MTNLSRVVPFLLVALLATAARAQVTVSIELPSIRFHAAPALVTVSPGIQVVEDYGDEVYFANGWYWVRHGKRWFRTRDHRGGWVVVERGVPPGLTRLPPGKYKHFKGKKGAAKPKHPRGQQRGKAGKAEGRKKGHDKGPSHRK